MPLNPETTDSNVRSSAADAEKEKPIVKNAIRDRKRPMGISMSFP
jgi:hypothetical protein